MIIRSDIIEDSKQVDGRRWITERHLTQFGEEILVMYMADDKFDAVRAMQTRAPLLYADVVQREVDANIAQVAEQGSHAVLTLHYSAITDIAIAARAAFKIALGQAAVMLGDYLDSLPLPLLQTAFDLSAQDTAALKAARLTPAATTATAVRSTVGA